MLLYCHHIVIILSSYCHHIVIILSSYCHHIVIILSSYCLKNSTSIYSFHICSIKSLNLESSGQSNPLMDASHVYILVSYWYHIVIILLSYCYHIVIILLSYCYHIVIILEFVSYVHAHETSTSSRGRLVPVAFGEEESVKSISRTAGVLEDPLARDLLIFSVQRCCVYAQFHLAGGLNISVQISALSSWLRRPQVVGLNLLKPCFSKQASRCSRGPTCSFVSSLGWRASARGTTPGGHPRFTSAGSRWKNGHLLESPPGVNGPALGVVLCCWYLRKCAESASWYSSILCLNTRQPG